MLILQCESFTVWKEKSSASDEIFIAKIVTQIPALEERFDSPPVRIIEDSQIHENQ